MYILPQILELSKANLLLNQVLNVLKEKLYLTLNKFLEDFSSYRYSHIMFSLQELMNNFNITFLVYYIEALDMQFKNSIERKSKYHINKSNVNRTIVTIFGELNFKRTLYKDKKTGEYYFYIDDILNIEAYKTYDCIVRAILINDAVNINPNNVFNNSPLNYFSLNKYLKSKIPLVSKQTIYNFKRETKIKSVNYKPINNKKTLYVMVDEKWIHKQDKNNPKKKKYIMSKCFVTFTGIERKGKRSKLIGRHIFITSSDKPWKCFMNEIYKIYDFEKLETINLLSDAGTWILSGAYELKLYSKNKIIINTCEFHVKQKINRSTTDKELRTTIANIIYENEDKKAFIKEMDKLIESKTKESRKQKIGEYKNYILKHWKGIINMKHSLCKSSMEAHIEHCIASIFSSVPKAYSDEYIEPYLKLQEMKLNNINILEYYLKTYNSNNEFNYYDEKEINFSLFDKLSTSNFVCSSSSKTLSKALYGLAHPLF